MDARMPRPVRFLDVRALYAPHRAALDAAWARVLDSGRLVLGPELEAFEGEWAAYCGTREAVGVGNGLEAIHLVLAALGVGPGDEVVVPAHTFIATWLAVARTGATPVPAEPDPATCLATAATIAARLTPRTRAVIAVPLYGSLQGIEAIAALCAERGIHLVEDAAQAHGAVAGGRKAGSFGRAGCFSFYPSKNLGAFGDGGAITTDDAALAAKLRSLRNYGSRARYEHEDSGTNSRLDELQAALLRVRLPALDAENARRRELAALYLRELAGIDGLQLPVAVDAGAHAWHLFVVQAAARDALQAHLARAGCETLVHYPKAVYRFAPFAAHAPAAPTPADAVAARVLSLPMGSHLDDADVHAIAAQVAGFFGGGR
jgi:dTDP-3-amino-3,4,6-trideoxy-alpha-D-glucose transaminase